MKKYEKLFIDGTWVECVNGGREPIEVLDSATNEVFASVPQGSGEDIDKAIKAASRAQPLWAAASVETRAGYLKSISEGISARSEELSVAIARETGMPKPLVEMMQVGTPAYTFESCSRSVFELSEEPVLGNAKIARDPVGVVACITPWNFPLHQIAAKVAPALAAGCTVVLKPAGLAPVSAFILAEIMESVNLPAGVFNLVSGKGSEVGDALVSHPLTGMVSFTGSVETGRHVAELAGRNLKKVALELGGKSASVVLDRASLEAAVPATVGNCFLNSGQTCSALTRLLVPEELYEEAAALARSEAEKLSPGNPLEDGTTIGPLVSAAQKKSVLSYIVKGKEEGAELVFGGLEVPDKLDNANFVLPTIFGKVKPDSVLGQEEIFGPVLSIITFRSEEEAVRIANGTPFGLNSAVWSADEEQALRVARQMESGQVHVNGPSYNPDAPFGGFKASGFGRELGPYALEEFYQLKAILKD